MTLQQIINDVISVDEAFFLESVASSLNRTDNIDFLNALCEKTRRRGSGFEGALLEGKILRLPSFLATSGALKPSCFENAVWNYLLVSTLKLPRAYLSLSNYGRTGLGHDLVLFEQGEELYKIDWNGVKRIQFDEEGRKIVSLSDGEIYGFDDYQFLNDTEVAEFLSASLNEVDFSDFFSGLRTLYVTDSTEGKLQSCTEFDRRENVLCIYVSHIPPTSGVVFYEKVSFDLKAGEYNHDVGISKGRSFFNPDPYSLVDLGDIEDEAIASDLVRDFSYWNRRIDSGRLLFSGKKRDGFLRRLRSLRDNVSPQDLEYIDGIFRDYAEIEPEFGRPFAEAYLDYEMFVFSPDARNLKPLNRFQIGKYIKIRQGMLKAALTSKRNPAPFAAAKVLCQKISSERAYSFDTGLVDRAFGHMLS